MAEKDPDTNGSLPPKISLKPKQDAPKSEESASKNDATPSQDSSNGPKKPVAIRKPNLTSPQKPKPAGSTQGPKPISLKKNEEQTNPSSASTPDKSKAEPQPAAEKAKRSAEANAKPKDPKESQSDSAQTPKPAGTQGPKPIEIKKNDEKAASPAPPPASSAGKDATDKESEGKSSETEETPKAENAASEEKKATEEKATPKRPVLRPAGAGAPAKKPTPVGTRKEGHDPLAAPGTKKSTSRITLPSSADKSSTSQIKTIKIPPKSKSGKIEAPEDGGDSAEKKSAVDPKRQTSRISLESVLGGGSSENAPNAPSTIKIKRSAPKQTSDDASEAKTLKRPSAAAGKEKQPDEKETAETTVTGKPESQKKTLKVKRPAVASKDRPAVSDTSPMFTPPVPTGNNAEPDPNWAFAIVTLAATIIAGILIYVLTAQVMDPDLAETRPQDHDGLPWPARYSPE